MCPNFKTVFEACYPIEEAIMNHLDHSDFLNLRLAGIRVSTSTVVQEMHLIPTPCDEHHPTLHTMCQNNSRNVEIRVCEGHSTPFSTQPNSRSSGNKSNWTEAVSLPFCYERLPIYRGGKPPRPVRRDVCISCLRRDSGASRVANLQDGYFREFWAPLCHRHSLDQQLAQKPHNACRCLSDIDGRWRCNMCCDTYSWNLLHHVKMRHRDLQKTQPPISSCSGDQASVKYKACPIPECNRPACANPVPGLLQQCLGCSAIFFI